MEFEWPSKIFGLLKLLVNEGVFFTFPTFIFHIGDNASF